MNAIQMIAIQFDPLVVLAEGQAPRSNDRPSEAEDAGSTNAM